MASKIIESTQKKDSGLKVRHAGLIVFYEINTLIISFWEGFIKKTIKRWTEVTPLESQGVISVHDSILV